MKKVGFIGVGNMGAAIVRGILSSPLAKELSVSAYDQDEDKLAQLVSIGVHAAKGATEIAAENDYVFLVVKPQNMAQLLEDIRKKANREAIYVSIAAGISSAYIQQALGFDAKVVLVMPNTPFILGEGASALARTPLVSEDAFALVCRIFESRGKIAVLDESQMKEIIAINGSSPAFIYLFAKAFMSYAAAHGIAQETALPLFCQTLTGAAKMMTDSGKNIDELIEMVSSKGGTTIAGLSAFYERDLEGITREACERCLHRAEELAQ